MTPDVANGMIRLEQPITQNIRGPGCAFAPAVDENGTVATGETRATWISRRTWTWLFRKVGAVFGASSRTALYGVTIEAVGCGRRATVDKAESYTVVRRSRMTARRSRSTANPLFQRLILDQGYWPDRCIDRPLGRGADSATLALSQEAGYQRGTDAQKVFGGPR
jgi:beta-glucuronidase